MLENKFQFSNLTKNNFFKRLAKLIILTFFIYIYSLVNALQDSETISDTFVENLHFKGKKVFKVTYADLEKISQTNGKNRNSNKMNNEILKNNSSSFKNNEYYYQNIGKINNQTIYFSQEEIRARGNIRRMTNLHKASVFYDFAYPKQIFFWIKNLIQTKFIYKKTNEENEDDDNSNIIHSDNTLKNDSKQFNLIFDFNEINSHEAIGKQFLIEVFMEKFLSKSNNLTSNQTNQNLELKESIFDFNLKTLYGINNKLKINNWDLVKLIENKVMSNEQAYKFWLELIKINKASINSEFIKKGFSLFSKTFYNLVFEKLLSDNRSKNNANYNLHNYHENKFSDVYSNENNNANNDVYIFNIFPSKSTGCWIFSSIFFIINYNIISFYNNKDYTSPLINFALLLFSLIMTENLYAWKIYFSSNIFLIQFIYTLKFFIFSLLDLIGFRTVDFDIFSEFPKNKDKVQIIFQSGTLFTCTLILGIFSFYRYNYFINYIFFYYCLLQLPSIFSVNFYNVIPVVFQPFRYFLILTIGLMNLILINFGKNNIYQTNNPNNFLSEDANFDSLYIIGDLFTIYCFSFTFDYLFIQSNNISILFKESEHGGYINKEKLNEKITKIIKNYKELIREFEFEDCIWFVCFCIGFFMQYIGLKFHKYVIYYFSYYFFRMVLGVYGRNFTIKCLKLSYSFLIFVFLVSNFVISTKEDNKLFEVFIKCILIFKTFKLFIYKKK